MTFKFSQRSIKTLNTVHPDLQKVVKLALELSEVDFGVTAGNRTQAEQDELYAQGRTKPGQKVTWTRNSRHIDGYAVDLLPYLNGKAEWDNSGKLGLWSKINEAMQKASKELNIPIIWGGLWQTTPDRPHFELDRKHYPCLNLK